jgi:hypothetical protein
MIRRDSVRVCAVVVCLILAFLVIEVSAAEQTETATKSPRDYLESGEWELSPGFRFLDADVESSRNYSLGAQVSFGYFIDKFWEVGGIVDATWSKSEAKGVEIETSSTRLLLGPQLVLNIPTKTPVVPYVRGALGLALTQFDVEVGSQKLDDTTADFFWGAGGGLRFFVSESTSVNVGVSYVRIRYDQDWGGDLGVIAVDVALSIYL